jgi:hypothetical protein
MALNRRQADTDKHARQTREMRSARCIFPRS